MENLLQNVDLGTLLVLTVGAVLLCVVGIILFFGLQIISSTLGLVVNFFDLFADIIGGGPVSWCGCFLVMLVCAGCAGIGLLAVNCSSNPASMNFCVLFAR
jgi:hypothetical protein